MRFGVFAFLFCCFLFCGNGGFARAVHDSVFEKAVDAESAGDVVNTIEDGKRVAREIGYPVVSRPALTLGGTGG